MKKKKRKGEHQHIRARGEVPRKDGATVSNVYRIGIVGRKRVHAATIHVKKGKGGERGYGLGTA